LASGGCTPAAPRSYPWQPDWARWTSPARGRIRRGCSIVWRSSGASRVHSRCSSASPPLTHPFTALRGGGYDNVGWAPGSRWSGGSGPRAGRWQQTGRLEHEHAALHRTLAAGWLRYSLWASGRRGRRWHDRRRLIDVAGRFATRHCDREEQRQDENGAEHFQVP
jgi:hypothetical protein